MFVGHFAPALVAAVHKDAPRLPVLFIAAQLVDWAFFGLLLTGTEAMRMTPGISVMNPLDLYHMPYTHSLVGALVFGGAMAAIIWAMARRRGHVAVISGLLAGAVVVSHWFLDWMVHIPDLTWAGQLPKLGFGLWNYPAIEMPLELALIIGPLWIYARVRKPATGRLLTLAGTMLALQAFNWFGPVDTSVTPMLSIMAFAAYGFCTIAAGWVARSETQQ